MQHRAVPAMALTLTPAHPPTLTWPRRQPPTDTGYPTPHSRRQGPVRTAPPVRTSVLVRTSPPVRTAIPACPDRVAQGHQYGHCDRRRSYRSLVRPRAASGTPQGPGGEESTSTGSTPTGTSEIPPARDSSARESTSPPSDPPAGSPPLRFPQDFFSDPGSARAGRRLLLSVGGASALGLGANFLGVTSFLLSFDAELARRARLDVLYPVLGFKRCLEPSRGFEFIYPSDWLGDQRLVYRAAQRGERERYLDLPSPSRNQGPLPLPSSGGGTGAAARPVEPAVAFGPAGGSGELNISVIVADVDSDFRLDRFGSAESVGKRLLANVVAPPGSGLEATLLGSSQKTVEGVLYDEIEFQVVGPRFRRHNRYACCVYNNQLLSLNAQAPEERWDEFAETFKIAAGSFRVLQS